MYKYKKKNNDDILTLTNDGSVPLLKFKMLAAYPEIRHCFTTRFGGVSQGEFATMNFVTIRGDTSDNVQENYKRVARAIDVPYESLTASYQTHTTNIRQITLEDRGKGITAERDYTDIDGLITNQPGITLVTFYADCVPLYFFDPIQKAIGLSHGGWKGTLGNIAGKTVAAMSEAYGTNPKDIIAAIGPSICQDCYEISEDVAGCCKAAFTVEEQKAILLEAKSGESGKYQLNLWKANQLFLEKAGITKANIAITNICTCCNPDLLFSHRASQGRRGNMAAFLGLR